MVWRIKPGRLYAGLEKLEELGFVSAVMVAGSASPQRKEFTISAAGEKAFMEWMRTPVPSARDFRQVFLYKLYFRPDVDQIDFETIVLQQQALCGKWLNSLKGSLEDSDNYEKQVNEFRIIQVEGIMAWLGNLVDEQKIDNKEF